LTVIAGIVTNLATAIAIVENAIVIVIRIADIAELIIVVIFLERIRILRTIIANIT
jgi:hypothetical protein